MNNLHHIIFLVINMFEKIEIVNLNTKKKIATIHSSDEELAEKFIETIYCGFGENPYTWIGCF